MCVKFCETIDCCACACVRVMCVCVCLRVVTGAACQWGKFLETIALCARLSACRSVCESCVPCIVRRSGCRTRAACTADACGATPRHTLNPQPSLFAFFATANRRVQGENNVYRKWPMEFTYGLDAPKGHLPLTNALRGTRLFEAILEHPAFAEPAAGTPGAKSNPDWLS